MHKRFCGFQYIIYQYLYTHLDQLKKITLMGKGMINNGERRNMFEDEEYATVPTMSGNCSKKEMNERKQKNSPVTSLAHKTYQE